MSPMRNGLDWNTNAPPPTALKRVPRSMSKQPPGREPPLRVNHWTHVSQSPAQVWRPGLDRGERLVETMVGTSAGFDTAGQCGWQPAQMHEHMHARIHRVHKKPRPPPGKSPSRSSALLVISSCFLTDRSRFQRRRRRRTRRIYPRGRSCGTVRRVGTSISQRRSGRWSWRCTYTSLILGSIKRRNILDII